MPGMLRADKKLRAPPMQNPVTATCMCPISYHHTHTHTHTLINMRTHMFLSIIHIGLG